MLVSIYHSNRCILNKYIIMTYNINTASLKNISIFDFFFLNFFFKENDENEMGAMQMFILSFSHFISID